MVSGLASCIIYSIIFLKYKKQKKFQNIYVPLSIICLYTAIYFLYTRYLIIAIIFSAFYGFFIFPLMPTIMELITRYFSEFPYFFTNSFLTVYAQILTVIVNSICGAIFDYASNPGFIVFAIILYMMLMIMFFVSFLK